MRVFIALLAISRIWLLATYRLIMLALISSIALHAAKAPSTSPAPNAAQASQATNATQANSTQESDPLSIGITPAPPAKQSTPSLIHNGAASSLLEGNDRDFLSVMNQGGGVLAVWSRAPASWIWAHSATLHQNFRDGFNWAIQPSGNGFVRFINRLTRTCLQAYGKGAIHYTCDANNPHQLFRLLPMNNGAIAIQSASTNRCLQTSIYKKINYPIILKTCLNVPNAEQQWFLIPPFLMPKALSSK